MLPNDTQRFLIIIWNFQTVMLLEPVYNCTYLWCKFFNIISAKNYLNQSLSSFKSCANSLAGHNLSNPCLRKKWWYVTNHIYDEPRFNWILKDPINLPDVVLHEELD